MEGSVQGSTSHEKRARMVREIQRTRLGGVDRITLDDEAPFARYAHIYSSALGTNLHTTDWPESPDDVYADDPSWRFVGVIDLDTGELADV